ncbi:MAG: hypothetical protein K2Y40_15100 [Reyranella sp.]|nr:hypothetical protein [Reyranella sp.]
MRIGNQLAISALNNRTPVFQTWGSVAQFLSCGNQIAERRLQPLSGLCIPEICPFTRSELEGKQTSMIVTLPTGTQDIPDDGKYHLEVCDDGKAFSFRIVPGRPDDKPDDPKFIAGLLAQSTGNMLLITNLLASEIQNVVDHPRDFGVNLRCRVWSAKMVSEGLRLAMLTKDEEA